MDKTCSTCCFKRVDSYKCYKNKIMNKEPVCKYRGESCTNDDCDEMAMYEYKGHYYCAECLLKCLGADKYKIPNYNTLGYVFQSDKVEETLDSVG